ncbi:ABC transporter permease [Leifsonia sp. ZF2019]|uniref:ABC transporter permease n=1 Tax=Leifsonia sp. ZF2019 TaxID=2781978 RepID=UPI001CBF21CE|nr:ABC transporter permease [Leifsonia sp. ZF2019]UAJ78002.1 ABC transporter permease [Leifsonia sp. ZF2019]
MIARPLRLAKYHVFSLWNWRFSYLAKFIEPLAYFVFLVPGVAGGMADPSGYGRFAFAGMCCFLAFRAATNAMSDVANDRKWGVFALYTLQGGSVVGYLVSIVIFTLGVLAVQITLVALCGLATFGWDVFGSSTLRWLGIAVLIAIGWIGAGVAVGSRIQSYAKRDMIVVLTSLPVVLSAPLFYSLETAPAFSRIVSTANPLTYQVGWIRGDAWGDAIFAALWAALLMVAAVLLLRNAGRVSSER